MEKECNLIRKRFETLVAVPNKLPSFYDNQKFDKPNNTYYAKISILTGASAQVELGDGNKFRNPGVMVVQLFGPTGKGDARHLQLIDKIKENFRGVSIANIVFTSPSQFRVGTFEGEYQMNVNCPFYFDE
jgi:hypothetical protein